MMRQRLLTLSPLKITSVYLVFGTLWISTTDWLVVTLFSSPETMALLQTIKGWVFVLLSGLLIFGLTTIRQRQIDRAREQIENTNEQLQVLHRIFRHNIRNDITVVQGYIELVQEQLPNSETQAHLETAHETADEISETSEKIKVLNETDVLEDSAARIDLVNLATEEVADARKRYPKATISTAFPDSATINGDPSLRHAIREVLEKALEHNTNPESECQILVRITQAQRAVELEIIDNGPSINDDELAPLEVGAETDLMHMSGVGLWLATWLSNKYNGEMSFDTKETSGTVVTFCFETDVDIFHPGLGLFGRSAKATT